MVASEFWSSSTHSRRRRCRRLSKGGGAVGEGQKSPTAAAARTDLAVLYACTHATTRGSRLPPPPFADRVEYSGSSVQSTRQNGYSLLYDAHSVLSVRFLFAVLFHLVFYIYLSLLGISRFASSISFSGNRKRIGNRHCPQSTPARSGLIYTTSLGKTSKLFFFSSRFTVVKGGINRHDLWMKNKFKRQLHACTTLSAPPMTCRVEFMNVWRSFSFSLYLFTHYSFSSYFHVPF